MTLFLAGFLGGASPSATADPAAAGSRPRLLLGWYDAFRLCGLMMPDIQREILGAFEEMNVHAEWADEPRKRIEDAGTVLVRILVLRKEPTDWGLTRATLGVVMKEGRK